jgi:hypothetical protein
LPSGDEVKTKNPPPSGSGLINFVNESKPDRRAGQQRVRKQQVQVLIHGIETNAVCFNGQTFSSDKKPNRIKNSSSLRQRLFFHRLRFFIA